MKRSAALAPRLADRSRGKISAVLLAGVTGLTLFPQQHASGQLLMRYLPQSVPGYQLDPALAVLQNGGPDYRSSGVRIGDVIIRPEIDETVGYNDNPLGLVDARSSPVLGSSGSISLNSDWSRDSLGASLRVDDLRYTALSIGDQTSYSAFVGGRLDIDRDSLDISGGRVSTYIAPTDVLSQGQAAPVPFRSNDLRVAYTTPIDRLTLTPSIDFTTYAFGHPHGEDVGETSLDRDQIAAGLAASYELSPGHNVVGAVVQTNASLLHRTAGDPARQYNDSLVLGGLDYDTRGAFRYDVLLGYEVRDFSGGSQSERQTPAAEISVTWRPSTLTTINASGIRHLTDASASFANDLVYNEGKIVLYHELYRNVILTGDIDVQSTEGGRSDGGGRTALGAGGGATYLLDRNIRLDLEYQFAQGSGFTSFAGGGEVASKQDVSGTFRVNLLQWTVHLGF